MPRIKIRYPVIFVLLLALINGLVYGFIVPPWQHYDEPNHFEYAWLIANRPGWPKPGDYDPIMRREVAESMVAHGFFRGMSFLPDLGAADKPVWIGSYSQLDNPPLYYFLASLPLRGMLASDVTRQLYAARLVSLGLYLLSVLAAWGVAAEIFPNGHPLRILTPLTLALLPGFTDLMTAVNNDVGAVAFMSLTLWGSVRLARRGFALFPMLAALVAAAFSFFSKGTAFLAVPLLGIALILAIFRARWRWLGWTLVGFSALAVLGMVLSWGDAALWHRSTSQVEPTRTQNGQTVLGAYAFQLQTHTPVTPAWVMPLFQPIPSADLRDQQKKTYTLAGWMWASRPVTVSTPKLADGRQFYSTMIELTAQPRFFAFTAEFPDRRFDRLWVTLDPQRPAPGVDATIFYDGLLLAAGVWPVDEPPRFDDPQGVSGVWGGRPFRNLLRNASAETAGLRVQPRIDDLGAKYLPDHTRPAIILTTLLDGRGTGWFFRLSADTLFRTFWGKFGWGHVPLAGRYTYRLLLLATIIGLTGGVVGFVRQGLKKWAAIPWEAMLLFIFVLLGVWGSALTRGVIYMSLLKLYLPVARYAFPAIIPTVLWLAAGWLEGLRLLRHWRRVAAWGEYVVYAAFFFGLDVWSIRSILCYYGG